MMTLPCAQYSDVRPLPAESVDSLQWNTHVGCRTRRMAKKRRSVLCKGDQALTNGNGIMLYQASWDRIKARLRSEVTADTYEKWIRRTAGYLGDGEFVISVPDGATRNFLESKLAITVLGLVREFALPVYEIRYKVSSNKTDLEYSEDAPVHPFDDDMNPVTDVKRWHKPKPRHLLLYTIDEHDAPLEDSHWKILGLQPGSTEEQIHKVYRKLSFSCHPDHGGNHALFANLRQAYERALAEVRNERALANDLDELVCRFVAKMKYLRRRKRSL